MNSRNNLSLSRFCILITIVWAVFAGEAWSDDGSNKLIVVFTTSYENTSTALAIDDKPTWNGVLTTNPSWAFAKTLTGEFTKPSLKIDLTVEKQKKTIPNFKFTAGKYLIVGFDSDQNTIVVFQQHNRPPFLMMEP